MLTGFSRSLDHDSWFIMIDLIDHDWSWFLVFVVASEVFGGWICNIFLRNGGGLHFFGIKVPVRFPGYVIIYIYICYIFGLSGRGEESPLSPGQSPRAESFDAETKKRAEPERGVLRGPGRVDKASTKMKRVFLSVQSYPTHPNNSSWGLVFEACFRCPNTFERLGLISFSWFLFFSVAEGYWILAVLSHLFFMLCCFSQTFIKKHV